MKPSEILRKAKALIDTPEKWTKGHEARDKYDCSVGVNYPGACKFCTLGALGKLEEVGTFGLPFDYLEMLMGGHIPTFNDTHTHAEVMAKWDEAIALAEADEKEGV